MYVSSAFLWAHRPVDKPLYCSYPAGYQKRGHALLLKRYLYGLCDWAHASAGSPSQAASPFGAGWLALL